MDSESWLIGLTVDNRTPLTIIKPQEAKRTGWYLALPKQITKQLEKKGIIAEHVEYGIEVKQNGDLYFHLQPRAKPWVLSPESE